MESLFHTGEDWHSLNRHDFAEHIHSLNVRDSSASHKTSARFVPEVVVVSGSMRGTAFRIVRPQMRCGRSVSCDISLDDPSLSRIHCLFEVRDGHLYVTDLSSANGTVVNAHSIGSDSFLLRHHDLIVVGDTTLKIVFPSLAINNPGSTSQKKDYFPTVAKLRKYFNVFLSSPWSIKIAFLMVLWSGIDGCIGHIRSHGKGLPFIAFLFLWLAHGMLKRYGYVRIVLVIMRVIGLIFSWYYIFVLGELSDYAINFFITFVYTIVLFVLLFLPSSNRWFHGSSD